MSDKMVKTVKKILLDLEAKGMIEIVRYNEAGEPIYGLTPAGEAAAEKAKEQQVDWN